MKAGVVIPFNDARTAAELAREAEAAGWDGVFVPELVWGVDPWVQLAAAAMTTATIRLGTMLTPLPWTPPWKLASESVALDHLSGGRVILSVGLGAPDAGATGFPLELDRRLRAELLDEGLEILAGLWTGEPLSYEGKHHRVDPTPFSSATRSEGIPPPPATVQQPRIPVWVVGVWPSMKSIRRALRWDGIIPGRLHGEPLTAEDVAAVSQFVRDHRGASTPFDIVVEGETRGGGVSDEADRWHEAGATWWIESRWSLPNEATGIAALRERIAAGPPRAAGGRRM